VIGHSLTGGAICGGEFRETQEFARLCESVSEPLLFRRQYKLQCGGLPIFHKVSPVPPLRSCLDKAETDCHMKISSQHTKRKSTACGPRRYLLWIILAIIVLAVLAPTVAMFSKKNKAIPPKSNILVPLYVYPAPGAWEPLFNASATKLNPSQMTLS
jgi:hypothetical protein